MVRLKNSLSDTNPLIPKKKKKKTQTLIKKDQVAYPQKRKKKKKKEKRQTLKPKSYILIKIQTHFNLRFFITNPYTHKSD